VVIANLMGRYRLKRQQAHPQLEAQPPSTQNHHILLKCSETTTIPMPHCSAQVVFTTAFMDEIMEQQSQTNPIILSWPDSPPAFAIAGRISRP
jgi:hypothetical protein